MAVSSLRREYWLVKVGVAVAQAVDDLFQRAAAHPLHGEVLAPLVVHADVVDGHHRRVLELPLNARLAQEALAQVGTRIVVSLMQALHRDIAQHVRVAGDHDLAHCALAERLAQAVALAEVVAVEVGLGGCLDLPGRLGRQAVAVDTRGLRQCRW